MYRIAIIGAGNLAWHLAPTLLKQGHEVTVFARRTMPDEEWPVTVNSTEQLRDYSPNVVILAIPDGQITSVSELLATDIEAKRVVLIHCSGATSIKKINPAFQNRGVLWPIRSLKKGTKVTNWRKLPIAYQASTPAAMSVVKQLVDGLTWTSYELDSPQRAQLHLAAVFSNNFVSWMYQVGHELVAEKDIPFSVLLPIIRDTAMRQTIEQPKRTQTGAAARADQVTMNKHLKLLNGHPEWSRLYRLMSRLIQEGLED